MPNALTHKYINGMIFESLDRRTQFILSPYRKEFDLGSLGPDVMMGLMLNKERDKKYAGDIIHVKWTYSAFMSTARYLRAHPEDLALYAYFMGMLSHYAADSVVHPYVYEYIDRRMLVKYDPVLSGCLHTIVETEFDVFIGQTALKNKHANTYWQFSWGRKSVDVIERYFLKVNAPLFNLKSWKRKDIRGSLFYYTLIMLLCQRSRNGRIRYWVFSKVDNYLKAEHLLLSALRPRSLDTKYDYLNMERKPYRSVYLDATSPEVSYSFPEMIDLAKEKGVALIKAFNEYLDDGIEPPKELFNQDYNGELNEEFHIKPRYYPEYLAESYKELPPFRAEQSIKENNLNTEEQK